MKKFTIICTILAILVVMASCHNEPQSIYKPEPEEEIVWTRIDKISNFYSFSGALGSHFSAEFEEESFYYKIDIWSNEDVDSDSAVGEDFHFLELDTDGKVKKYEGLLEYRQADEGMGERNWRIAFIALADEYAYGGPADLEKRENELAKRPAPNQMRMFIYDAHGVGKWGDPIPDEELGWKTALLNGWLAVEFSDFMDYTETPSPIIDESNRTKTYYEYKEYYNPKTFTLISTDISDMEEESVKLSALPAFDTKIIGLKFKRY